MFDVKTGAFLSPVEVMTTMGKGFSPEEIAARCMDKILQVSDTAPEPIRKQAKVFQEAVHGVVLFYLKEAVKSDRTSVYNELKNSGFPEAAELLRRL